MFRKLISNLSYSPSLIGEVAKLAQRLKQEERMRRFGVVALGVALLLNTFALINPPESTNTAHDYDLLYGGVQSKNQLLSAYDRNEAQFRDISHALGIERSDIAAATPSTLHTKQSNLVIASRKPLGAKHTAHTTVPYPTKGSSTATLYLAPVRSLDTTPLTRTLGSHHVGYAGLSQRAGEFIILRASGSIALQTPPQLAKDTPTASFTLQKKARNETQRTASHLALAQPSDRITYTLSAHNKSPEPKDFTFSEHVSDILEYADIVDTRGGSLDLQKKTLTWPVQTAAANTTLTQTFVIRLKTHLPATAQGSSNPHSYDCLITNTFGTTTQTPVQCPPAKLIEPFAALLPRLTAAEGITTSAIFFILSLYLYLRARQQKEEIRLIRRDVNEGTIG